MKTGRVYKIIALAGNEVYVGSTFNTTRDRFSCHKNAFKRWKEGKIIKGCSVFNLLFDKYGVAGCKMVLIKEYECVDRAHLEAYEQLWINKLKSINKNNPFGSGIKYLDKEYFKEYYEENKQRIKEYYEENKQRIKEYYEENKQRIKEYYENNKRAITQRHKEYYEENKATILEKIKQKIECPICGKSITKKYLKKHQKTIHPPPAALV